MLRLKTFLALSIFISSLFSPSWAETFLPKPITPAYLADNEDRQSLLSRHKDLLVRFKARPSDPQILLDLSETEAKLGYLDEAIKHIKTAEIYAANSWQVNAAKATYLAMNRSWIPAQIQWERTLELAPKQEQLKVQGPYLVSLIANKRFQQADKLSQKWLAKEPKNPFCLSNRAWVLSQMGLADLKKSAIETYYKAIATNASPAYIHYNLALLLAEAGDRQSAVKELDLFAQKDPSKSQAIGAQDLISRLANKP